MRPKVKATGMLINKINIQNNILKNNLVYKGQCPVCGSSERKSSENSSDTQKGNEYLKSLSDYLKIDLYQMLKTDDDLSLPKLFE